MINKKKADLSINLCNTIIYNDLYIEQLIRKKNNVEAHYFSGL